MPTVRTGALNRISWLQSVPFFGVHLVALTAPLVGVRWSYIILAVGLYYTRMLAITAGFHRYFSHRSFKTSRVGQFLLALVGTMSVQKGVLWWSALHRHHHKNSDTEDDIHSPSRHGFWWAHCGWILARRYEATDFEAIKDFARYPELRWLNKWHLAPSVLLAVLLFVIGGLEWLIWGFFVSTTMLWHGTFTINSLAHLFGRRRYRTADTSRNSFLLALLTLGEGWHNNHHRYEVSCRQGFRWWEIDVTYYGLKVLSWFGIVWDLRKPPYDLVPDASDRLTAPA